MEPDGKEFTLEVELIAQALLLEMGSQMKLTKRQMKVFMIGVNIGQAATFELLDRMEYTLHEPPRVGQRETDE